MRAKTLFSLVIAGLLAGAACGESEEKPQWVENSNNGHWYALTQPLEWAAAENRAVNWGGHLVTVNDQEEETWLKDTFGREIFYWIGFNDIEEEGNWVWTSGEPVTYTNWGEGLPDNCHDGPGFCVPESVAQNFCNRGDYWNDVRDHCCSRGIVERTSPPTNRASETPLTGVP